jgi:TLC domain
MEDPFPAAPSFVATATAPLARALHLHTLPLHAHEIAAAAIFYSIVKFLSPRISTALVPNVYPRLPRRTRLSWDVHVVSFVQSVIVNFLALALMIKDGASRQEMDATERVWAYTGAGGLIQALAAGYFLWDLIVTAMHTDVFGPGMLAHAISAFTVYMLGFVLFSLFLFGLASS